MHNQKKAASDVTGQSQIVSAPPAVTSPEVLSDNRVIFRIYAPHASQVSVGGDWVEQGLADSGQPELDKQGVWSITVGPLPSDFYTYAFSVDGVRTIDPANTTIKPGVARIQNILTVPVPEMDQIVDQVSGPYGVQIDVIALT